MLAVALGAGIAAAAAGPAAAQTPPDTGVTFIRAGRVFDSERGTFTGPRDIVVRGGRITAVAERAEVPRGARVVDLRRYTVLPGLIDAHTHLLYLEHPAQPLSNIREIIMDGGALRALHGAARARTFLAAGITSVRDLGNAGAFNDVALKRAIDDGSMDGPRVWAPGPGLSGEGGHSRGCSGSIAPSPRRSTAWYAARSTGRWRCARRSPTARTSSRSTATTRPT